MKIENIKVKDIINFRYQAGTHPGAERTVEVEEIRLKPNKSHSMIFGTDLDKKEPRQFIFSMMKNIRFIPKALTKKVSDVKVDATNLKKAIKNTQISIVGFIISNGVIHLLVNNQSFVIPKSHYNYQLILDILSKPDYTKHADELVKLADVSTTIQEELKTVEVKDGEVYYGGKPLHNVVTSKILQLVKERKPFQPMVAFLQNLMGNPSERSINELYNFLERNGLYLLPDGCFLGFKAVTKDYKDYHTKTFNNKPGMTNSMPRENVDDDCNAACSKGFHVGTHKYAEGFGDLDGGHVLLVKVNPKDCVSVPLDANCEKLRVCSYTVIGDFNNDMQNAV